MNPLREVIARFTTEVDSSQLDTLDKKIGRLKGNYGALALGATASLAAIGVASYKLATRASDVTEMQNKISAIFGPEVQRQIIGWSQNVEKSMGRSEFAFQAAFSDFAAFLDPMDIGLEKTVEMSKKLSELKVDLASFYNTSEDDAQMRLFSGMAGETEAVRRLGIDISETSLAALYNSDENPLDPEHRAGKGGAGANRGKGLTSLTLQQKTILRYTKILKDTKKVQGDAARTATGFANTLKRLEDRFDRLQIAIGKLVEGPGTKFMNFLESAAIGAEDLAKNSNTLQAAVVLLTSAAVVGTLAWAAANATLLQSMLIPFGLIAATYLIVEDFMTFMDGGESGFGYLIKAFEDIAQPAKIFKDLLEDIDYYLDSIVEEMRHSSIPGVGVAQRALEATLGGRDFFDDSHTIPEDPAIRRQRESLEGRKAAAASGDHKAYIGHRRVDQTEQDSLTEFKSDRARYLEAHPESVTERDLNSGVGGWTESANTNTRMGVGGVTVAPVTNINVTGQVDVGMIEKVVRKANTDGANQAAAALRRRGKK